MQIYALSRDPAVCQGLAFSYGVEPTELLEDPKNWRDFAQTWLREHRVPGQVALLVAGPSTRNHEANYRLEFLRVGETTPGMTARDLVSRRSSLPFTEGEALVR